MTFAFDTGEPAFNPYRIDRNEAAMDAILDALGDAPTQDQIAAGIVAHALAVIHAPKTLATIRRDFICVWPLIAPLAERAPADFDAIITEFAERTTLG